MALPVAFWDPPWLKFHNRTDIIIGRSKNLGTKKGAIISSEDVNEPQEATTWKYYDGEKWNLDPRNVIVTYS